MIPALFGTFLLGFFAKENGEYQIHGQMLSAIIPVILVSLGAAFKIFTGGMEGIIIMVMLPITILCAYLLFKKGKISVQKNPNYVSMFQKNTEEQ